jgi:hypothetical protein
MSFKDFCAAHRDMDSGKSSSMKPAKAPQKAAASPAAGEKAKVKTPAK